MVLETTLLEEIFNNNHPSIKLNKDTKIAYLSQIQGRTLMNQILYVKNF